MMGIGGQRQQKGEECKEDQDEDGKNIFMARTDNKMSNH
jgi:hypothetical protein